MKPVHSQRLERWLGRDRIEALSAQARGWYGPPIALMDVPGAVFINGDGDFSGNFERGYFMSAIDSLADLWRRSGRVTHGQFGTGFASLTDAITKMKDGNSQTVHIGGGDTGSTNGLMLSNWVRDGGSVGSAAPGGRNPTVAANSGGARSAVTYTNPNSGQMYLTGADIGDNLTGPVFQGSYLLYDRLFDVAKTMNSTATEAVTGTQTRYNSTTVTDPDYVAGNFVFPEVTTALAATAHNWTVCQYTNQAGTTGQSFPSAAGRSSAGVQSLDLSANFSWFMPLAAGDSGVKAITQLQCDALVATGAITFVLGHPIAFLTFPLGGMIFPQEWLISKHLAPRILDSACLTLLAFQQSQQRGLEAVLTLTNTP